MKNSLTKILAGSVLVLTFIIFTSTDFTATADDRAETTDGYMIVDLTTGNVITQDSAPDLNNEVYKATKMVLRKIPAGTFSMGSPESELGHDSYGKETLRSVTLTNDFYMGVFEVTQKQYETVMGSNPSSYKGDQRPVETVRWNDVRGVTWPSGDPGLSSFMGKLRILTGGSYKFDLPTEAQWEYACRAGTTTALNNGNNLTSTGQCSNMDKVARYACNRKDDKGGYSEHTTVGSYQVNNWGLYDMHGNVWEWCLDWYQSNLGSSAVTNPKGASTGSRRSHRGGGWYCFALYCRSASRIYSPPSHSLSRIGFRVILPIGQQ